MRKDCIQKSKVADEVFMVKCSYPWWADSRSHKKIIFYVFLHPPLSLLLSVSCSIISDFFFYFSLVLPLAILPFIHFNFNNYFRARVHAHLLSQNKKSCHWRIEHAWHYWIPCSLLIRNCIDLNVDSDLCFSMLLYELCQDVTISCDRSGYWIRNMIKIKNKKYYLKKFVNYRYSPLDLLVTIPHLKACTTRQMDDTKRTINPTYDMLRSTNAETLESLYKPTFVGYYWPYIKGHGINRR